MKLLPAKGDRFVLHLSTSERALLTEVLKLYPVERGTFYRVSREKGGAQTDERQRLLDESITEQKRDNRARLRAWLGDEQRFKPEGDGVRVTLEADQIERLLQMLNEIRIGSWLRLGAPDQKQEKAAAIEAGNAPYFWAMMWCGHFEAELLEALGSGS